MDESKSTESALFTLEDQLSHRMKNQIANFWQLGTFSQFEGAEQAQIHYAEFKKEENKKCLIIVPGRTEAYLKYQELSYDLFQQGFNIFLLDHRGQGLSQRLLKDPHKGHVESFQYYVDDLQLFIKNIVKQTCQSKPYLLAHSMGGAIATRYLQQFPDTIQAAVLSAPMLGFNTGNVPKSIGETLIQATSKMNHWLGDESWYFLGHKGYSPKTFESNELMHSKIRFQIFQQVYKTTPSIQLGGVTVNWLVESIKATQDIFNDIGNIKTPIILLQSGDDKIVDMQAQNDFCQQLHRINPQSCPEGKPFKIEGAYHELLFEIDDYRNQALLKTIEWFKQHKLKG